MKRALMPAAVLLLLALAVGTANALVLTRGVATPLTAGYGTLEATSATDQVTIDGAYVAAGTLDLTLDILTKRVQYDVYHTVNNVGEINSLTIGYDSSLGDKIIAAATPISYIDTSGTVHVVGGAAYATLLNAGYGAYAYNTGAPWTIDYQADHITFIRVPGVSALPYDTAIGVTNVGHSLPSFSIQFDPSLLFGDVQGQAMPDDAIGPLSGIVTGPVVPEPASLIMLACPLAVLAVTRRRRG